MCIFIGSFGFLNFDLGGWGVQIRNQRLRKLPTTELHPNQITFGIFDPSYSRSGGPSCPRGPSCSTSIYKIYNKVGERLPKTTKKFIQTCNSLMKKI